MSRAVSMFPNGIKGNDSRVYQGNDRLVMLMYSEARLHINRRCYCRVSGSVLGST